MSVTKTISRWGNARALRIPGPMLEQLGLDEHSKVTLSISAGKLIITPVKQAPESLNELLEGARPEQFRVDGDDDWLEAGPVGKEIF